MLRRRSRSLALFALPALLGLTGLLGLPPGSSLAADPSVPDVPSKGLPVAGTAAPLGTGPMTRVVAGPVGGYRLDGGAVVLDDAGLVAALKERAGSTPGLNRHSVWVTMAAADPFLPVGKVINACNEARIFRIGLEVQDERGATGLGFPLFLPGPPPTVEAGAAPAKGHRIGLVLSRWEGAPSNPARLYAAASLAVQRHPPVVAEVSLDANLSVQHAVTCLDMLYRGGVAGVRLKLRTSMTSRTTRSYEGEDSANARPGAPQRAVPTNLKAVLVLSDQDQRTLPSSEPNLSVPPLASRTEPWGDDGANQPGWLGLVLENLPTGAHGTKEETEADDGPLPTYAGRREGAPTGAIVAADQAVSAWTRALGSSLRDALNRTWTLTPFFATRLRDRDRFSGWMEPLVTMFPGTQRVVPSTLRLDAYLLKGTVFVGKVETTLHTAGSAMSLIFARWVTGTFPTDSSLPPPASDPFAAGVPGHMRVWLESAFATVHRQGAEGLPLAPASEVLAQLPTVAQAGSTKQLDARTADLDVLAKWLRVTEYDRLLLVPRGATAAVHAEGRVAGIVQYSLESEERELRLTSISGRAAPR